MRVLLKDTARWGKNTQENALNSSPAFHKEARRSLSFPLDRQVFPRTVVIKQEHIKPRQRAVQKRLCIFTLFDMLDVFVCAQGSSAQGFTVESKLGTDAG